MLLSRLKKNLSSKESETEGHRQRVKNHMEIVQRALAGEKEFLRRLAQIRQTSPMGHDPSEPIPTKVKDNG